MTGRGRIAAVTAVALALGVGGIGLTLAQQQSDEAEQKRHAMTTTHEIGILSSGTFTPIATLTFDDTNTGTLVLGAYHPRASQLVQVWADLSKRDEVRIEKTVYGDDDSVGLMSVLVKRTDPEFPDALLRLMANQFGFDARPLP